MSQFKKILPFADFIFFGALLYFFGYVPESEIAKTVFCYGAPIYLIWFTGAYIFNHNDNKSYHMAFVFAILTIAITYLVPDDQVTPKVGAGLIAFMLYGALTGSITRLLHKNLPG